MKRLQNITSLSTIWLLLFSFVLAFLSGCSQETIPDLESHEQSDLIIQETTPEYLDDPTGIYYSKSFVDPENLNTERLQYEYENGSVIVAVRIDNEDRSWECGVTLSIDGVFQRFSIVDGNGSLSEPAYMHTIDITSNSSSVIMISFEPSIGKAGQELSLEVGTMINPSFRTEYIGQPVYGHPLAHSFSAAGTATIVFREDAPQQITPSKTNVSVRPIDEEFINSLLEEGWMEEDLYDRLQRDYFFSIQGNENGDVEGNIIYINRLESPYILFEVYGRESEYRASLFIDHEPVVFSDGSFYFDFEVNDKEITDIEIPIETSRLPIEGHLYIVLFAKNNGELEIPDNTYIIRTKTDTYFLLAPYIGSAAL